MKIPSTIAVNWPSLASEPKEKLGTALTEQTKNQRTVIHLNERDSLVLIAGFKASDSSDSLSGGAKGFKSPDTCLHSISESSNYLFDENRHNFRWNRNFQSQLTRFSSPASATPSKLETYNQSQRQHGYQETQVHESESINARLASVESNRIHGFM